MLRDTRAPPVGRLTERRADEILRRNFQASSAIRAPARPVLGTALTRTGWATAGAEILPVATHSAKRTPRDDLW